MLNSVDQENIEFLFSIKVLNFRFQKMRLLKMGFSMLQI